ncbi:MAG: hypothetical protein R6U89_10565 [Dehalococcoidia bacterium]
MFTRTMFLIAAVILSVVLILGCSSSGQETPENQKLSSTETGVLQAMKMLPEDTREIIYWDISSNTIGSDEAGIGFYVLYMSLGDLVSYVHEINWVATTIEDDFITKADFDEELIKELSENTNSTYRYANIPVRGDEEIALTIIDKYILGGSKDFVQDCISVIEDGNKSLYDNEEFRDIVDRLPKSESVSCGYSLIEEFENAKIVGGSINGYDEPRLEHTTIIAFSSSKVANQNIEQVREELTSCEAVEFHDIEVIQDGAILEVTYWRDNPAYRAEHEYYEIEHQPPSKDDLSGEMYKTYGGTSGDFGTAIQATSDGGYIICGSTYSRGDGRRDVLLIKTDSGGDIMWERSFGNKRDEQGHWVQQTNEDGYIIVALTRLPSNPDIEKDILLIKTDSDGNEIWNKTIGRESIDDAHYVEVNNDGGYLVIGETHSHDPFYVAIWLIKTDADGNEVWNKTIGETGDSYSVKSAQITSDKGHIIAGHTWENGEAAQLVKIDSDGNKVWENSYKWDGDSEFNSVQQTSDGGYIAVGRIDIRGNSHDVLLIKADSDGNMQWRKMFHCLDGDEGESVWQTRDGGFIITGQTGQYEDTDIWLIKTNSNGEMEWNRIYGGLEDDQGRSVLQTEDGGYVIIGSTKSYGDDDWAVLLIKTDSKGNPE